MYCLYLHGISHGSTLGEMPLESLKRYVQSYVRDACGQKEANPILRTLAEQFILTHHMIGRLHCDGVASEKLEARRLNIQLAISLTGELRRLGAEIHQQLQCSQQKPFAIAGFSSAEKPGGRKIKLAGKRNVA